MTASWTETETAALHRRANELWDAAGRPPVDPLQFVPFAEQEQMAAYDVSHASKDDRAARPFGDAPDHSTFTS